MLYNPGNKLQMNGSMNKNRHFSLLIENGSWPFLFNKKHSDVILFYTIAKLIAQLDILFGSDKPSPLPPPPPPSENPGSPKPTYMVEMTSVPCSDGSSISQTVLPNYFFREFKTPQIPFAFEFECERPNGNSVTVCHRTAIWKISAMG